MKLHQPKELPVPEEIRVAATMGRLTFFIGAGVSRLYGLPSWDGLANKMLSKLAECGKLNHSLVEILSKYSTKVKISIADYYFKENRNVQQGAQFQNLTYHSALMDGISKEDIHKNIPVYKLIADCNVKLLTTNYDNLLADVLDSVATSESVVAEPKYGLESKESTAGNKIKSSKYTIFRSLASLEESTLTQNNILVHLHGSLHDEDSMISSTQSYLKLYGDKKNQERLNLLFQKQTVVFIGYGLEELEILDLILRSSSAIPESEQSPRFFLVLPLLSHEIEILKHLQIYYAQLGVTLLPYSIDNKNYHALTDVLEEWTKTLRPLVKPPSHVDHSIVMDQLRKQFNELTP